MRSSAHPLVGRSPGQGEGPGSRRARQLQTACRRYQGEEEPCEEEPARSSHSHCRLPDLRGGIRAKRSHARRGRSGSLVQKKLCVGCSVVAATVLAANMSGRGRRWGWGRENQVRHLVRLPPGSHAQLAPACPFFCRPRVPARLQQRAGAAALRRRAGGRERLARPRSCGHAPAEAGWGGFDLRQTSVWFRVPVPSRRPHARLLPPEGAWRPRRCS